MLPRHRVCMLRGARDAAGGACAAANLLHTHASRVRGAELDVWACVWVCLCAVRAMFLRALLAFTRVCLAMCVCVCVWVYARMCNDYVDDTIQTGARARAPVRSRRRTCHSKRAQPQTEERMRHVHVRVCVLLVLCLCAMFACLQYGTVERSVDWLRVWYRYSQSQKYSDSQCSYLDYFQRYVACRPRPLIILRLLFMSEVNALKHHKPSETIREHRLCH